MVECLAQVYAVPLPAALLANTAGTPWWIDSLGHPELVIAAADFIFLLAVWVVLVLLWIRMDRLIAWLRIQAEAHEKLRAKQDTVPQPTVPGTAKRNEEQELRMTLISDQLRNTTEMVREFLPVLKNIRANQAASLAAQSTSMPNLDRTSVQPPAEIPRVPFEQNYNAVFTDPARDERVPGIKEQFRVNFRDKGSADRNPEASSPLVRDPSGWLSVFIEEGTGVLYLAPSLAFRAGTLMNTQVSKLSSLFTFPLSSVTRLERAATVRRAGEEFHLDQMGSMS